MNQHLNLYQMILMSIIIYEPILIYLYNQYIIHWITVINFILLLIVIYILI